MRRTRVLVRTALLVGALAMVFPSAARAGSITIQSDFGGSRVGYFFDGQRYPPPGEGGVPLGGLAMGDADIPGFTFPDTFTGYCVEILGPILEPGSDGSFAFPVSYTADAASMTTWSDASVTPDNGSVGGQRAAYLYTAYGDVIGNDERTALQMAIWEVLYDTDLSVSLTTGRFYVDPDDPEHRYTNIANIADDYLRQMLLHPTDVAAADATWLQLTFTDPNTNETTNVQDFIGPASTNAVPEPGSLLLLGTGMAALTAFRRKARS